MIFKREKLLTSISFISSLVLVSALLSVFGDALPAYNEMDSIFGIVIFPIAIIVIAIFFAIPIRRWLDEILPRW